MIIASEIRATGLGVFPCTLDKSPAIPRGTDWRELGQYPTAAHIWPTEIVGVPVPPGVVVIDLDTYKDVTRQAVEALLGVVLPWDEALLQTTMQGGQHYAFQCDWDVMQGSGLLGLKGFDTRVGTKGYICTGMGYISYGVGVARMAEREALPTLPSQCQAVIGRTRPTLQPTNPPPDLPVVVSALTCIDPACSRGAWVKIGMALRAWAGDDPDGTGAMLFEQWSSGVLGEHDPPHNYVPEQVSLQWESFKPQGDTTIGSLFYEAIQAGWKPPSRMDTALAFGPGGADMNAFNDMVDRVTAHGCDPKQTAALTKHIEGMGGNKLQTATLLALLTRELKQAGLLTKPVREQLDGMAGDTNLPRMRGGIR